MTAPRAPDVAPPDPGHAYWQRHARRYDRSTRLLDGPLACARVLAATAVRGRAQVLELAAGTGAFTTAIAPEVGALIATDYADAMVDQLAATVRAAGLANVTCARADLYDLPYADASFDAVVAANVLHLVPDLPRALASLRRVLHPDGVLVAPTYLHRATWRAALLSRVFALTGFPGRRRFDADSLRAALAAGGFEVTRLEIVPGPFPIGHVEAVPARADRAAPLIASGVSSAP
ncbi:MAG: methyltransferase domain-containing protein [Myxococcales bacterium]|nr:methyltransferase domain-containing protein [Myxococcales bacterium]